MRKAVKGSYAGQIRLAKCNVDDNKETYERYKGTDTKIAESTEHKITKVRRWRCSQAATCCWWQRAHRPTARSDRPCEG